MVYGINETVNVTCRERGWAGIRRPVTFTTGRVTVSLIPDTVDAVLCAPDDGWGYHPKHVEQLTDLNKLYPVASCWIIIAILYDALSIEHTKRYLTLFKLIT